MRVFWQVPVWMLDLILISTKIQHWQTAKKIHKVPNLGDFFGCDSDAAECYLIFQAQTRVSPLTHVTKCLNQLQIVTILELFCVL